MDNVEENLVNKTVCLHKKLVSKCEKVHRKNENSVIPHVVLTLTAT